MVNHLCGEGVEMKYRGAEHWWRGRVQRRPWWMNGLMYFCFFMAAVQLPWDFLFHPPARDQQVWFGIMFHGWWAKLGELAHWVVFAAGATRLAEAIADLPIAVVVANAGCGLAGRFESQSAEQLRDMVQLNCISPVMLVRALLPRLQARGRGAIIVTGSVAGRQPVPFNAVYSATKAFDLAFGEALWAELQGGGIDVLVIEPGPTVTEFQAVAGETPHAGEPPAQVVGVALNALGL
jgi:hypothetical protein